MTRPREFDAVCERTAQAVARTCGLFAPGLTIDDLVQEARIGVWKAIRDYQPAAGPFDSFAWLCAHRSVLTAVKTATTGRHRSLNDGRSLDEPVTNDGDRALSLADLIVDERADPVRTLIALEELAEVTLRVAQLTPLEQECVRRVMLMGDDYTSVDENVKRVDNALHRARRKLRSDQPLPAKATSRMRSVFVDRNVHPDAAAAIVAALEVIDGQVVEISKRKLLDGRERAPQGRPDKRGRRGQPVWRVDILRKEAA